MTRVPECTIGRVIGYSFLWSHEAAMGLENGLKARPCVIMNTIQKHNVTFAYVSPITHRFPVEPDKAVEIPAKVKFRMGLDAKPSWLVCSDFNVFTWPGADLAAIRLGDQQYKNDLGALPPGIFNAVREKMQVLASQKAVNLVPRFV